MKNTLFQRILSTLLLLCMLFMGCDKSFEAKDTTIISAENVTNSGYPGASLMALSAWIRLVNVMDDVSQMPEIATENADETDSFQSSADFDQGEWHLALLELNVIYAGLHDARNQANLFLNEYLNEFNFSYQYPTAAGTPPVEVRKNTLRAYNMLVRGWSTLYLGLLFEQVNFDRGERLSPAAALDRAIADFTAIEAMYTATSNVPEAQWNGLNIRRAAYTLLAKAYLQLGQYPQALAASAKGLTKTDAAVNAPYEQAFGSGPGTGANVLYSTSVVANSASPNKRFSMNKFFITEDPKDNRVNLDSVSTTGQRFVQFGGNDRAINRGYVLGFTAPRCLRKLASPTLAGSYIRILSWQENALIAAEAKMKSGDLAGGIAEINAIRMNVKTDAGTPVPLASATDLSAAMAALEYEIRMEMCGEIGEYFIALRRWDRTHAVNTTKKFALPIPSTE